MGLDMYLHINKDVPRVDYQRNAEGMIDSTERPEFHALVDSLGVSHLLEEGGYHSLHISVPVGYWRKANQIHGWIINNIANGVDNCQEIWLAPEKMKELLDICKEAKAGGAEVAKEVLPPQAGFFFGDYEIDEWYWGQVDYTINLFEKILADKDISVDGCYYQASW